jgi:hypothetical protein
MERPRGQSSDNLGLVRGSMRFSVVLAGVVGLALLGVGVVYLTVECQALPGFLGPVHGDASPRTPRGIVGVVLGLTALTFAFTRTRRRPPTAPRHP